MDHLYQEFHLGTPESVRFLKPQKRSGNGHLTYEFIVTELNSDIRYSALSYVWGDPDNPGQVYVDGRVVPVTTNLLAALEMFDSLLVSQQESQDEITPSLVWADQLCINQHDPKEKSIQVALMGQLYSKAEKVYISLGESETALEALNLVTEIDKHLMDEEPIHGDVFNVPVRNREWLDRFNWASLRDMLLRPWFKRIWVIQEAGLAKHAVVLYGGHWFRWESLMRLLAWLSGTRGEIRRHHDIPGWTTHRIWASFDLESRDETAQIRDFNFLDLISHAACTYKATVPRDHIYAFLGYPASRRRLVGKPRSNETLFTPDYTPTNRTVFVRFAVEWLKTSQSPHLLSCVNHRGVPQRLSTQLDTLAQDEFPTWCPRWDYMPLGGVRFTDETYPTTFQTATSCKFQYQYLPDDRLQIRGFRYDTVAHIFPCLDDLPPLNLTSTAKPRQGAMWCANLIKVVYLCHQALLRHGTSNSASYKGNEEMMCSFAATAMAAQTDDARHEILAVFLALGVQVLEILHDNLEEIPKQYKYALDFVASHCREKGLNTLRLSTDRFLSSLNNHLVPRRLYLTKTGRFGLGPHLVVTKIFSLI